MTTLKSWLCGEWREGNGGDTTLVNPATGAAVARCSTRGLDLQAALAYARDTGGPALRAMTFAERGALLKRMSTALHEARELLVDALAPRPDDDDPYPWLLVKPDGRTFVVSQTLDEGEEADDVVVDDAPAALKPWAAP